MPAKRVGPRFELVATRWRDLAEKRLEYYTELYHSGRWRHYYAEEHFMVRMRDVILAVKRWRAIAEQAPEPVVVDDIRPAA
jgi:uncharacterized repeat protein (TIGR03809 family)